MNLPTHKNWFATPEPVLALNSHLQPRVVAKTLFSCMDLVHTVLELHVSISVWGGANVIGIFNFKCHLFVAGK